MTTEVLQSWKCDEGDVVEFHFSRRAMSMKKTALKGTVISREPKLATIRIEGSQQEVRVHVSLIRVLVAPLTKKRVAGTLQKKFKQCLANNKTIKKDKENVVCEVGGMKFQYRKKCKK